MTMTQNIYDDETFFRNYSLLDRSVTGLDGAPEWPALRAMLPDLRGRKVLDLGCGFGWFCRWAREHEAAEVLGIDVSQRMLAQAKASTTDAAITYTQADLESAELPAAAYDLVYSSLAFHYLTGLEGLMSVVHRSLRPGGSLVFSVEHPIYTAPTNPGWSADEAGRTNWPVNHYLSEGPRFTDWLTDGVRKHHRTIATYVSMLLRLGFVLRHLDEWGPGAQQIAAHPEWAVERERPMFLLIAAERP
jgi:SAM-dependent methyltransferase